MSGVLGGEVEMVRDIVEGGRLQGGGFTTAAIAQGANVPMLQLPELPFLFRSAAEVDHVLDNVLYEPAKKKLKLFLNGKQKRLSVSMPRTYNFLDS